MKMKVKEIDGNPYKEASYSVYHNGCLHLLSMLCGSYEPQEKVQMAMEMLVNMRSEIRVTTAKVSERLYGRNQRKTLKSKSKK